LLSNHPTAKGDSGPNSLDEPEWPSPLQKSIDGTEATRCRKPEDEPIVSPLKGVEDQHGCYCEQTKRGEQVHPIFTRAMSANQSIRDNHERAISSRASNSPLILDGDADWSSTRL
jgi:hypothetical protein